MRFCRRAQMVGPPDLPLALAGSIRQTRALEYYGPSITISGGLDPGQLRRSSVSQTHGAPIGLKREGLLCRPWRIYQV